MDSVNTHSPESFYAALDPAKAPALAERLRIHYARKHSSQLYICKFSLLMRLRRQCLDRRISETSEPGAEMSAWQAAGSLTAIHIDLHAVHDN